MQPLPNLHPGSFALYILDEVLNPALPTQLAVTFFEGDAKKDNVIHLSSHLISALSLLPGL